MTRTMTWCKVRSHTGYALDQILSALKGLKDQQLRSCATSAAIRPGKDFYGPGKDFYGSVDFADFADFGWIWQGFPWIGKN